MRRPVAHVIGDVGEIVVEKAFMKASWITNKLHRDYGFDFIVQYAPEGVARWAFAFIQVKSVKIELSADKSGKRTFSVSTDQLENWSTSPVPAFLAICEMPTERIYLVSCHETAVAVKERYGSGWRKAKERTIPLA